MVGFFFTAIARLKCLGWEAGAGPKRSEMGPHLPPTVLT